VFHETPLVIGLWDGYPLNPGHALLVPRRHISSWFEASTEERQHLLAAIDVARDAILANHEAAGFNIGWNDGTAAGQTIPHLHIHIIPRIEGDVADPRGGVRHVIPSKAKYWQSQEEPPFEDELPHAEHLIRGGDDHLLRHIVHHIPLAVQVDVAVAFIYEKGLALIRPYLEDLLNPSGRAGRLRLLTGDYRDVTQPDALEQLLDLDGDRELRVYETDGGSFHPKAWIFHLREGGIILVGSSNLSQTALREGVEWNYRSFVSESDPAFRTITRRFDELFEAPKTKPLTHEWIEAYRKRWSPDAGKDIGMLPEPPPDPVTPHRIQQEALEALADARANGKSAGLVVLATGLGKTWLSAFDSERFDRVLFVAHRDEILDQAVKTFRRIRPSARIGKFTGQSKDDGADVMCASIQTLSRAQHLDSFAPDHFDYVIVDEFHHASAATYRRLLGHFEPKFLLGLTATPERTDGADLLRLCQDNLIYRCDLARGIREQLLCPFHYFGIPDDVDYQQIPWRSNRFDEEELTNALATAVRAQNALEQHKNHGGTRTLAFCCSKFHADFMASFFRDNGLRTAAVYDGSSAPRANSLQALADGRLDVLFCVDMFNEGIDIPNIDTVLMLRPTASRILWLQQFGRGLRTADDKDHLRVIDYIGNHRVFLNKPAALLAALGLRPSGDVKLLKLIAALEAGTRELPDGCAVTYDLEAIDILRKLMPRRAAAEALRVAYEDFRARADARPTAVELYESVGIQKSTLRGAFGGWFGLVATMGDLDEVGSRLFDQHGAFLRALESTKMTRSYKMLVLQAMIEADALPGSITTADLATRVQSIARRSSRTIRELGDSLDDIGDLRRHLLDMPIRAWVGSKSTPGGPYFELEGDRFSTRFDGSAADRATFQSMVQELVDWRLAEYFDRVEAQDRFECKVFHNKSYPILKLPDRKRYDRLPEGVTPILVDGKLLEANFAKIAINVAREPGSSENALPSILEGWFGKDAGKPGMAHFVVFERVQDGWELKPKLGPILAQSRLLKVMDDESRELDATFRIEDLDGTWTILFQSRGGTSGGDDQRNLDYNRGLELVLQRLANADALLLDAAVESGRVADLPLGQRRIEISGHPYPLRLGQVADMQALRRMLGRGQTQVGRAPSAKGSGSSTKTIRLVLRLPNRPSLDELKSLLNAPR